MAKKGGSEPRMEPKIKGILEIVAPGGRLEKAKKKQTEGLTEVGKIFQQMEKDLHGNRAAISMFTRIQNMSDEKRLDFLRTFEPLLIEARFTLDDMEQDLVDQAEDTDQDADADEEADSAEDEDDQDEAESGAGESPLASATKGFGHHGEDEANEFIASTGKPTLSIVAPKSEARH